MKGMKELVVQEGEGMVGVGKVHMEGRRVQCIAGDQVLIMVVRVVQFMTGMMAQHMKSGGVLIMGGTGALSMAGSAGNWYLLSYLLLILLHVTFLGFHLIELICRQPIASSKFKNMNGKKRPLQPQVCLLSGNLHFSDAYCRQVSMV